jgi:hypothetical protein
MLSAMAVATALCLSAGISSVPASASLLEKNHKHLVLTVPDHEICGITVTTTFDIVDNFQVRLAQSGFPLLRGIDVGTLTWTNEANGHWVTNFFAGAAKDLSVTDNGDGTITNRYHVDRGRREAHVVRRGYTRRGPDSLRGRLGLQRHADRPRGRRVPLDFDRVGLRAAPGDRVRLRAVL